MFVLLSFIYPLQPKQRHFLCLQSHVITGDQGIFSCYRACPSAVQFFYIKHLEWSLWNTSFPCLKLFIHFPLVSEENLTSSPGPKQPCITCLALQPPTHLSPARSPLSSQCELLLFLEYPSPSSPWDFYVWHLFVYASPEGTCPHPSGLSSSIT